MYNQLLFSVLPILSSNKTILGATCVFFRDVKWKTQIDNPSLTCVNVHEGLC